MTNDLSSRLLVVLETMAPAWLPESPDVRASLALLEPAALVAWAVRLPPSEVVDVEEKGRRVVVTMADESHRLLVPASGSGGLVELVPVPAQPNPRRRPPTVELEIAEVEGEQAELEARMLALQVEPGGYGWQAERASLEDRRVELRDRRARLQERYELDHPVPPSDDEVGFQASVYLWAKAVVGARSDGAGGVGLAHAEHSRRDFRLVSFNPKLADSDLASTIAFFERHGMALPDAAAIQEPA